ncbi:hypothetical protein KBI52_20225 [Microvirga sp. HBU67558]|uniref:beta strand repeat-containing protein n=1 Tax=Microvirga TaxID=186650 RepID=UPI001B375DB5|nr:hypothetical protein [Microvirga sp. HBU65207]MBQ0822515.1 hypothetical protein [Microvirga sp. HBU67558]
MTNHIYDSIDDLPTPGTDALIQLTDTITGSTIIDMTLEAVTGTIFQAASKQRVTIGSNGSIRGDIYGLNLQGLGSTVINDGVIGQIATPTSDFTTDVGIRFSGAGPGSVTNLQVIKGAIGIEIASTSTAAKLELINSGMIETTGLAVVGGHGGDRIVNTGTLRTTATNGIALDLGAGDDLYDGRSGTVGGIVKLGDDNDVAYGGAGNETISGGKGSNVVDGGDGNDSFIVGDGYNTINGASGTDTVDYSNATSTTTPQSGFTINLTSGSSYGNGTSDVLSSIENVIGSAFADTITGNFLANSIIGGNGDDTLDGGTGDDTLDGGDGNNTLRFTGSTAVTADLSKVDPQNTGYGNDKLINIRNLEGASGGDQLTGDQHANRLDGKSGNDTLAGREGNDTLLGEAGNDTLEGGAGNDTLDGGSGTDTAQFSGARASYSIVTGPEGVIITDTTGQDGADLLKDIRFAKFGDQTVALVNGSPTSISPSSASVSESAVIGATVATLFGSDPDGDSLTFTLLADAGGLFGISDGKLVVRNALDYETATQHVVTVKASDAWGGEFTRSLTISVRNNTTETMPITRSGTAAADQLTGESGNDRLSGLAGNDTLFGEIGADTLIGGAGNDTLVGGDGNDVFLFDKKPNVKSNLDYIQDFVPKDDVIHLSRHAFSKISKGTLSKKAFVVGDHFKDKDDRVLYLKSAGALFYDPDGSGPAKAVQFATITRKISISHKDFFIV